MVMYEVKIENDGTPDEPSYVLLYNGTNYLYDNESLDAIYKYIQKLHKHHSIDRVVLDPSMWESPE